MELRTHRLQAIKLDPEAFAPFGIYAAPPQRDPDWVASGSRVGGVREDWTATGAEIARLWRLGDAAFEGDTPYIGFVRYFHQGFRVAELERHRRETQTWLARAGTGFLVVAPATPDSRPDPAAAAAFLVEPGDLVSIGRGVWMCHFFPIGDHADYLVITARRSPEQDRDLVDFAATAGTVLEIVLAG